MKSLKTIILGSGSSIPTDSRNHSGYWIRYGGEVMLWDCGEGTQRQIRKADLSPTKIDRIFITHWHTDHFAGLLGLLETLKLEERTKKIQIYGPEIDKYISTLSQLVWNNIEYEIETININPDVKTEQTILENNNYSISYITAKHSEPAVAYCFQEHDHLNIDMDKAKKMGLNEGPLLQKIKDKGKINFNGKKIKLEQIANMTTGRKIVYSGDTAPSSLIEKIAHNADLLIHEATFLNKVSDTHSTIKNAADLAKRAKVKKLILTHYSQRFRNIDRLKEEAQKYFPDAKIARDLMNINLNK